MSIRDQLPELIPRDDFVLLFEDVKREDAVDLLVSAMYHEIARTQRPQSARKKKASQDFILECFRELMAVPENRS